MLQRRLHRRRRSPMPGAGMLQERAAEPLAGRHAGRRLGRLPRPRPHLHRVQPAPFEERMRALTAGRGQRRAAQAHRPGEDDRRRSPATPPRERSRWRSRRLPPPAAAARALGRGRHAGRWSSTAHYLTYCDVCVTEYWRAIGVPYPAGLRRSSASTPSCARRPSSTTRRRATTTSSRSAAASRASAAAALRFAVAMFRARRARRAADRRRTRLCLRRSGRGSARGRGRRRCAQRDARLRDRCAPEESRRG
ncbi:MAG: hypothetical protein MZW92_48600 [Comamonadaceae bacterium]|nr:hypothetical protein [Comamonadaceae bacterium]